MKKFIKSYLIFFILFFSFSLANTLDNKFSNDISHNPNIFTKEELVYIKNAKKLKVGFGGTEPFVFIKGNKTPEGIGPDIIEKVFKIAGLKYEFIIDKRSNLLEMIKNKTIDVLPAASYSDRRAIFGEFTQEYLKIRSAFFTHKDNADMNSFEDLKNKTIAIQNGYLIIEIIKKRFPSIKIIKTNSLKESIKKVQNKEVKAFFSFDLTTKYLLKKESIKNIKIIYQNKFKNYDVRMFLKKNDLLLKSILSKSLSFFTKNQINKIVSNWIDDKEYEKEVRISMLKGREPYFISDDIIKGIEYDLIKKILDISNIKIKSISEHNSFDLKTIIKKNKNLDLISGVKEKEKDYYYSDEFTSFFNVSITRKNNKIHIKSVKDLKGKKIASFDNSYEDLGSIYNSLFNKKNRSKNYKEYASQIKQINDFLENKSDVLVIDKNIFIWYIKKLKNFDISYFKFHYIFPGINSFKMAFKDKDLRDMLNVNIKTIKENGDYETIVSDYLNNTIYTKKKISLLISSIISKSINYNDIDEVKKIINIFLKHMFIKNIKIYNNKNEIIYQTKDIKDKVYIKEELFYTLAGVPKEVGFIKIYFDENNINEKTKNNEVYPYLELFKNFRTYFYIKNMYEKHRSINEKIYFTQKEKKFIKNNPYIKLSTFATEPFLIKTNNSYEGIIYDYVKEIEEKSNLKFLINEKNNFELVKNDFINKKADLIPSFTKINNREFINTYSFDTLSLCVVAKKNKSFINSLDELNGQTIALVKNTELLNYIKNRYPLIKIKVAKNKNKAFLLVEEDKVDASVSVKRIAIHYINTRNTNLKIIAVLEDKFDVSFKVSKYKTELKTIINKIISSISSEKKSEIKNNSFKKLNRTYIDYTLLYQLTFVFLLIITIVLFFLRKITINNKKIKEQKDNFENLLNKSTDPIALIKNNKYIFANEASKKIFGLNEEDILEELNIGDHSPLLQEDGQNSLLKLKKLYEKCLKEGTVRFEWLFELKEDKHIWGDIVFTKIVQNNVILIHAITRDITEQKLLEKEVKSKSHDLEIQNQHMKESNTKLKNTINNLKQTQEQLVESEKLASLGRLVAGVAHEINTPVGIGLTGMSHFEEITNNINTLYKNDEMSQDNFEEYLKTSKNLSSLVYKNLQKAATLVKSFKQVAVDQSSEEKRNFELRIYLDEILQSMHSLTKKAKVNISITCDDNIKLNSYAGAYSQIFTNLIMNSIIHGFEDAKDKKINICVKKSDKKLEIIYKDNGCGIKKENLSKIFEPFYTTNRDNGGSGLGLNIIYNIINSKLRGTINCKSKENYGVEFIIIITI